MSEDQSNAADSSADQSASAQRRAVRTCQLPATSSPTPEANQFSKYAIVGNYVRKRDDCFVQHAAILAETTKLDGVSEASVFHMAPPPHAGIQTASLRGAKKTITPQLVGDLILTNDECEAIDDWLAGVESECASFTTLAPLQYYVIRPHMVTPLSEEGRRRPRRFSCSGFVIEAYREADIKLLELESIPRVRVETLRPAYEFFFSLEERDSRTQEKFGFKGREDLGVDDADSWDVVLPGYLFHSTARATDENPRPPHPFVPEARHACFPCSNARGDENSY